MATQVPPPLASFGTGRLSDFLKQGLPATPRESLTPTMRQNLKDYESLLQERISKKLMDPNVDAVVICELDRAFNKTYSPVMNSEISPCLKTGLKYLFLMSTRDCHLDDAQRQWFRWLMPFERPALQGFSPDISLFLTAKSLIHAVGNAYAIPVVAACLIPNLEVMSDQLGGLRDWPPPVTSSPTLTIEDMIDFFKDRIPEKMPTRNLLRKE